MKTFLLLLLSMLPALAQLSPRIQISGEFTSFAQANAARNVISNKLASVKSQAVDSLDRPFSVSTNFGLVSVSSVEYFVTTNLQSQAIQWMQTNQFGGSGWTVTITSHRCPGTNQPPAGWLGCVLDSRAFHTNIVITP